MWTRYILVVTFLVFIVTRLGAGSQQMAQEFLVRQELREVRSLTDAEIDQIMKNWIEDSERDFTKTEVVGELALVSLSTISSDFQMESRVNEYVAVMDGFKYTHLSQDYRIPDYSLEFDSSLFEVFHTGEDGLRGKVISIPYEVDLSGLFPLRDFESGFQENLDPSSPYLIYLEKGNKYFTKIYSGDGLEPEFLFEEVKYSFRDFREVNMTITPMFEEGYEVAISNLKNQEEVTLFFNEPQEITVYNSDGLTEVLEAFEITMTNNERAQIPVVPDSVIYELRTIETLVFEVMTDYTSLEGRRIFNDRNTFVVRILDGKVVEMFRY